MRDDLLIAAAVGQMLRKRSADGLRQLTKRLGWVRSQPQHLTAEPPGVRERAIKDWDRLGGRGEPRLELRVDRCWVNEGIEDCDVGGYTPSGCFVELLTIFTDEWLCFWDRHDDRCFGRSGPDPSKRLGSHPETVPS
jgi:hypothetical protein